MPAPLSLDLRRRIAEAIEKNEENGVAIAARFAVSSATVCRIRARLENEESLEARMAPGREFKVTDKHRDWIRRELQRDPFLTSHELTERFNRRYRKTQVHRSTILRAMHMIGFSFKKKSLRAAKG